jgi:hypothetical protein
VPFESEASDVCAWASETPLLKRGGRFLFYVYRRKGPVRAFTEDYVRAKLADLPPTRRGTHSPR